MPRILLIALLLLANLEIGACATQVPLSERVAAGDAYMGIRLLGTLWLADTPVDGLSPGGLSGLAWDQDDALLYVISDSGRLFHLRPLFSDGLLSDVELLAAYRLRDAKGRPLPRFMADAEGLAIENGANGVPGDSRLLVSFEAKPRVARYSPHGQWLGKVALPAAQQQARYYVDPNKSLEAVAVHRQWGLLVAPERTPPGWQAGHVPIFAQDGRSWSYPLHKAPQSSLVAMEALPDSSLLTLERAFVSMTRPLVISLRHARLPQTNAIPVAVEDVAVFDTSQGWLLDNFEGLTRHRGQRFFMISDDNHRVLQSTLLVYFELLSDIAGD